MYHWNGSTWTDEQKLTAADAAGSDYFGYSVSISGEYAIVGAYLDDHNGTTDSGSAYVFHWDGISWTQQQKLTAADAADSDYFGCSVSISGEYAIVGAYRDTDNGSYSGSAYVFHWDGLAWTQQQKLTAADAAFNDRFGYSVSISGEYAIVGAYFDDDNGGNSGSAYVYHWDGLSWTDEQKLTAADGAAYDRFGWSVSISGEYAIVGAYFDDDNGGDSGSAYVFHWDGLAWTQQQKLTASDGAAGDNFGHSVSISGEYAIVGAYLDGDFDRGSAYVYHWNGSNWTDEQKLTASDAADSDYFGSSVSISGDYAVAGAYQDDDNGSSSGSAYVFSLNHTPTTSGIADVAVGKDAPDTVFSVYPSFADVEDTDAQLTYSIEGNTNPGLFTDVDISDPTNFTLDYAPDTTGTADITIRATDTEGLWVEATFTVVVEEHPSGYTDPDGDGVYTYSDAQYDYYWTTYEGRVLYFRFERGGIDWDRDHDGHTGTGGWEYFGDPAYSGDEFVYDGHWHIMNNGIGFQYWFDGDYSYWWQLQDGPLVGGYLWYYRYHHETGQWEEDVTHSHVVTPDWQPYSGEAPVSFEAPPDGYTDPDGDLTFTYHDGSYQYYWTKAYGNVLFFRIEDGTLTWERDPDGHTGDGEWEDFGDPAFSGHEFVYDGDWHTMNYCNSFRYFFDGDYSYWWQLQDGPLVGGYLWFYRYHHDAEQWEEDVTHSHPTPDWEPYTGDAPVSFEAPPSGYTDLDGDLIFTYHEGSYQYYWTKAYGNVLFFRIQDGSVKWQRDPDGHTGDGEWEDFGDPAFSGHEFVYDGDWHTMNTPLTFTYWFDGVFSYWYRVEDTIEVNYRYNQGSGQWEEDVNHYFRTPDWELYTGDAPVSFEAPPDGFSDLDGDLTFTYNDGAYDYYWTKAYGRVMYFRIDESGGSGWEWDPDGWTGSGDWTEFEDPAGQGSNFVYDGDWHSVDDGYSYWFDGVHSYYYRVESGILQYYRYDEITGEWEYDVNHLWYNPDWESYTGPPPVTVGTHAQAVEPLGSPEGTLVALAQGLSWYDFAALNSRGSDIDVWTELKDGGAFTPDSDVPSSVVVFNLDTLNMMAFLSNEPGSWPSTEHGANGTQDSYQALALVVDPESVSLSDILGFKGLKTKQGIA